jgi:hypothetical protein
MDSKHKHPDVNESSQPWDKSDKGKAWKEKGFDTLPANKTLSGVA